MKIIIGILLISCFLGRTTAQNANYKRAEETKAFSLPWKYDRLTPFFTEGSDDFWYSLQTNDGEKYFYVDLKNKKVEEFIDPVYLATEMVYGKSISKKEGEYYHGETAESSSTITASLKN